MDTKTTQLKTGTILGNASNTASAWFNQNSGTTSNVSLWGFPTRIAVNEFSNHIEMIYKQTYMATLTSYPSPPPQERVFKIIFSCQDGKWHKSEPIYGTIIPESLETYEFD